MANLNVTNLDFDTIKQNLKTFLQGQQEFQDYNFEGSGLSVLLDVLAYSTHYNGIYTNLFCSEMFIDSAVKRSSIVSRAKELGYTFKSSSASSAIVSIYVDTGLDTPTALTLPRGTKFRSMTPFGTEVTFVTTDTYITHQKGGQYNFTSVEIKEGQLIQNSYVYDAAANVNSIFEIPNADIDISTLRVYVRSSINDLNEDLYVYAGNSYDLTPLSKVFFIQENFMGNFEIQFGDGVLGKGLSNGNVIRIEYIVSHKAAADGCNSFLLDTFSGYSTIVQTLTASLGGSEKESTETIRSLAPKLWAAQNRIVTAKDYYAWTMNNVPAVESVTVWGGEDNVPPIYGKVFISIKPLSGLTYTADEKAALIHNYFKNNSVVTITPQIVDPSYIFVTVTTEIKYNPDLLTISPDALKTLCAASITNWFDIEMQKFDTKFYYSKFVRMIDDIDTAIVSNQTTVKLQRRMSVIENSYISFAIDFQNPIIPTSISSNYFQIIYNSNYYTVYATDSLVDQVLNTGKITLLNSVDDSTVVADAGIIYYSTGVVAMNSLMVSQAYDTNSQVRFNAESSQYDIAVARNNILTLDDSGFDITKNQFHGLVCTMTPQR